MPKKFFIIACEPSADLHASHLIEELRKLSPGSEFYGLGGPLMTQAGARILYDMTTLSALGFTDVLRQYPRYLSIFNRAFREVQNTKPDALILIDSPAFNLRFAKKISAMKFGGPALKSGGRIPTFYYISPQLWAWGKNRISVVKKTISKMLVILPFEKEMYDKAGIPCTFVGHPLLDELEDFPDKETLRKKLGLQSGELAIGILPGSRRKEVQRILPALLKTAELLSRTMPQARFFLSRSGNVPAVFYDELLKTCPVKIESPACGFQELVSSMDFAFVTSGTATLQTALLGTPFFLVYKASWLTYELGRRLIKVDYLGLVNLLAKKRVVPEFIQQEMHPETMAHEAKILLENKELYEGMKREFSEVKKILGLGGASRRTAESILSSF